MVNSFVFFALFNSIGSAVMWLMLGPYFSSYGNAFISIGLLGMLRQLSFIFGSLVGGGMADEGRPLIKLIIVESLMFIITLLLTITLLFSNTLPAIIFPIWTTVRFFIAGISFVIGYKFLSSNIKALGNSSIIHLITTQGATLFAPIIAIIFPILFQKYFLSALFVDITSSLIYIYYLTKLINSKHDIIENSKKFNFIQRQYESIITFWKKEFYPWNLIQFLFLVCGSGYVVYVFYLSKIQTYIAPEIAYPATSVIYGVALWITGELVQKCKKPIKKIYTGCLLIFISGIMIILFTSNIKIQFISFIFFVFGYWLLLHSTNKIILNSANHESSGIGRASMVFYLSSVFGIGEIVYGIIFKNNIGIQIAGYIRTIIPLLIIFILFYFFTFKTKGLSSNQLDKINK